MKREIVVRPSAHAEIMELYVFIGLDSQAVAERFLESVQATFDILAEMPNIGAIWASDHPSLQGIRYYPARDFPNHLIFYRGTADIVEVLHVYHSARNIGDLLISDK